jgi:uncharacterized protein
MEIQSYQPGSFCFPELNTLDVLAAKRFYGAVLGWTAFDVPSAAGSYMSIRKEWGEGVVARWQSYFAVADCAQSVDTACRLGADVYTGPNLVAGFGRFAVMVDPEGAVFCVVEPS